MHALTHATPPPLYRRRSMVFKARDMPDFSRPFTPDPSKAAPVTAPEEPSLHTDSRLGKATPLGAREDILNNSSLGNGRGDGAGWACPFTASLRSSTTALPSTPSRLGRTAVFGGGPGGGGCASGASPFSPRASLQLSPGALLAGGRGSAGPSSPRGGSARKSTTSLPLSHMSPARASPKPKQ
jgi:hypothetical protein